MPGGLKVNTTLNDKISKLKNSGKSFSEIAKELKIPSGTVKTHYYLSNGQATARMPESPYPRYDDPPEIEGDALIIPDAEIPFHHANFLNRVLDLADKWRIKKCIWAGDAVHFDSLSGWQPSWSKAPNGGVSDKDERKLMDFVKRLPKRYQQEGMDTIVSIGEREEGMGFTNEMNNARSTLRCVNDLFDEIFWILGNHEGRLLATINSPVQPLELLNLFNLENGKWSVAPFYFCWLISGGERFRITHPKSAGKGAAEQLASKYLCSVIMGHSHLLRFDWDKSGQFYSIQAGHCVDELRLSYASQRDTVRDVHKLGAVIIRDGYPHLLHEQTRWKEMEKMA